MYINAIIFKKSSSLKKNKNTLILQIKNIPINHDFSIRYFNIMSRFSELITKNVTKNAITAYEIALANSVK